EMRAEYEPYMPETFRRFGPNWIASWDPARYYGEKLDEINVFFGTRYKNFPYLMKKVLRLSEPWDLTVFSSDTTKGTVLLNGRPLDEFLTRQQGFIGMYFPETPVTLTAVPADGAIFAGWQVDGCVPEDASAATIQLTLTEATSVTALFE
ncbi:MAG: hypothetical protein J6A48_06345, partial [Clostridia bacterium]|nr:hypothetical protein [Clostridia bacterium]